VAFRDNWLTIIRVHLSLGLCLQYYLSVDREEWKLESLLDLLETVSVPSVVLVCNTRAKVDWLAEQLSARSFKTAVVHSGLAVAACEEAAQLWTTGAVQLLLTTDLPSIRIDTSRGGLVICFDLPSHPDVYLTRVGRRPTPYGRKCAALTFVSREEVYKLREIEHCYVITIEELPADVAFD
jgi:translation initiation factor 4A